MACERCQGNGEIVCDWEAYLHPPEGAAGDAGTETCPNCCGQDEPFECPRGDTQCSCSFPC
jgi:hypothetical protein